MSQLTDERRQQIDALLRGGANDRAISRQTGAHFRTVARRRRALGLPVWSPAAQPSCRHGHPYPENIGRDYQGHLFCRECNRISRRKQYVPVQPDVAAIERGAAGDGPLNLTPRERHAAILRLTRQNLSAAEIADRLRCSRRTVYYARSKAVAA